MIIKTIAILGCCIIAAGVHTGCGCLYQDAV